MNIVTEFLLNIIFVLLFVFAFFVFLVFIWFVKYRIIDHIKPTKGEYKYYNHGNFFKKIFWDFPKQFAFDLINRNPDEFRDYGFRLVEGKQGTGKTITVVYLLLHYKKMYPKLKIATNMNYKYEDKTINNWKDLVFSNNGVYGEIDVLDEIQNWFSCNQSKDFPPEMLQEITQQRKQRKMILGTSQVFMRVAKPIRENVYLVYSPITLFGCITIVRKFEPNLDEKGTLVSKKSRGFFFFVHNKKIREAFDTYKKIESMAESGFKPISEIYSGEDNNMNLEVKIGNRKSLIK